ncbi:DedA family protein [Bacillus siamensis]|uniref:DedA family protein n=1 Tax=Bacillus TaxID=1386 RepID=UPI000312403F|nr:MULTISPECIES: DedA family protein [Bacillus]MBD0408427.1 DedA family protein [Bacillus sp. 1021]MEC3656368.1 DedA family protein [Bacillus siamensis]MED0773601.1 DedA family protein [Bacillus siamensis]MED0775378.1 DedA family protein [Bacillus siamensis]MED0781423.1 DedA family protein [Bacillus siamensis]
MELVQQLISDYGYIAIFLMLTLGIIGLPIPDEVMMTLVGYFAHIKVLNYELSILISFIGALLGMIISYFIGRKAGRPFINKFGKWVGLKEKRMEKVDRWMKKYGPYTIILGYFIPGIRHVTCYFSGIGRMDFKTYLCFAAIGAFLWCFIFITIGKFIGVINV